MRILEKLLEVAVTQYQRIRVLLALVSSRFDYNSSVASYMPIDLWLVAEHEVDKLISIVAKDSAHSIQENTEDYDELLERSPDTEADGIVRIRGSIISFVDRLDDEFTKSLQNRGFSRKAQNFEPKSDNDLATAIMSRFFRQAGDSDSDTEESDELLTSGSPEASSETNWHDSIPSPHGTEYVDRLKDEKVLYRTICRAQALYESSLQPEPLARVIMRRLEHIYSIQRCDARTTYIEYSCHSSTGIFPNVHRSQFRNMTLKAR